MKLKIMIETWPRGRRPGVRLGLRPVHINVGRLWQWHVAITSTRTLTVYIRMNDR